MSKILVEVYVPAARLKYDAYIPAESRVGEVGFLLSSAISGYQQMTDISDIWIYIINRSSFR